MSIIPGAKLLTNPPRGMSAGKIPYRGREVSQYPGDIYVRAYLHAEFGAPTIGERSKDDKVREEWIFKLPDGSLFHVYDYKGWMSSGSNKSKSPYVQQAQDALIAFLRNVALDASDAESGWREHQIGDVKEKALSFFGTADFKSTTGRMFHVEGEEPLKIDDIEFRKFRPYDQEWLEYGQEN